MLPLGKRAGLPKRVHSPRVLTHTCAGGGWRTQHAHRNCSFFFVPVPFFFFFNASSSSQGGFSAHFAQCSYAPGLDNGPAIDLRKSVLTCTFQSPFPLFTDSIIGLRAQSLSICPYLSLSLCKLAARRANFQTRSSAAAGQSGKQYGTCTNGN